MSKNKESAPAASDTEKVGKAQLAQFQAPAGEVDFDSLQGESYVGLNLLNLNVGEADGPFKIERIETKEFGKGASKKSLPTYHCVKGTTPVQMPISASFLTKAEEAKLKAGDVFYIKRDRDFKSKEFGTENCKSYLIKVTSRG